MNIFCMPEVFKGFSVQDTVLPELGGVEMLIDIPGKKIYLNRAADQAANVVQVRFSRIETVPDRQRLLRRQ